MAKKAKKSPGFSYRDSKTGRFVKKSTWKRSKKHGGKRYKREKRKPRKPKIDPQAAIKKVLDELNLPLGGPFDGEHGLYSIDGDFSGPPEYLVSIRITGESGDEKTIHKKIRPIEDSEIFDFEPGWQTIGTTF